MSMSKFDDIEQASNVIKTLKSELNRDIIKSLLEKPKSVNELCAEFGKSQPHISKYVSSLKSINLINKKKRSREDRNYDFSINTKQLKEYSKIVDLNL